MPHLGPSARLSASTARLHGSIADPGLLRWNRVLLYASIDVSEKHAAYVIMVNNLLGYTTGRSRDRIPMRSLDSFFNL
jgi:hypothetical protein